MAEGWLEVYENRADHLRNNLRLNEISILNFSQFYFKINRNQLEIVVKATYDLHPNKYFEILHLTFWGRSPMMRRFNLHSNSRGVDEIKGFPILINFCNRNTKLLLLFSIIYLHGFIQWYLVLPMVFIVRKKVFWLTYLLFYLLTFISKFMYHVKQNSVTLVWHNSAEIIFTSWLLWTLVIGVF